MENTNLHPDELQHWGIKGMKWGIRRFQNKDGSLTPEGRKRYDDDSDNDSNSTSNSPKKAPHEMTGKDYKKMRLDDMTDEELAAAINRSRAEQAYKQLNPEPVSKGKVLAEKFVNEALIPVAVNAGKNFMDKQMNKIIDKALKDAVPKTELDTLKEAAEILKVKKDIADYKDQIGKIGKEKEKSENEKAKEAADLAKSLYDKEKYDNDRANLGKPKEESLEDAVSKYGKMGENIKKAKDAGFQIDDDLIKNMTGKGLKSANDSGNSNNSNGSGNTNTGDGSGNSSNKPTNSKWTTPDSLTPRNKSTDDSEFRLQIQSKARAKDIQKNVDKYLDALDNEYGDHGTNDISEINIGLMTSSERKRYDEAQSTIDRLKNVGRVFVDEEV